MFHLLLDELLKLFCLIWNYIKEKLVVDLERHLRL